jgi:hypothetical protein
MVLDHLQNVIVIDSAVSMTLLSFDSVVSMTPPEFWRSSAIDFAESWLSSVIGNLELEYLGEFATVFENILGCESLA